MSSPALLLPHILYSNYIPHSDAVHLIGSQLLQTINEVPVKFNKFDEDVKHKRWMNEFEGFLRDLEAHDNMVPVSKIQQNYVAFDELMVYDLEVRFQRFVDEVVAYHEGMKVKRWFDEFQGLLDDLKACDNRVPVSKVFPIQQNHAAFDELMAFDAIMTNELKNIVTTPDEEFKKVPLMKIIKEEKEDFKWKRIVEEDGIEEFEVYEDYCVMKHMRRQGAKRRRLSSRKHKYSRI